MYTSYKVTRARRGDEIKAKAMAMAIKRKEEYLGARVPRELKDKVIARARELDIPVSILIRQVLEEAFGNKKEVELDSLITRRNEQQGNQEVEEEKKYPSVLGWETIRLHRSAACEECGRILHANQSVAMGVEASGNQRILLCDLCKESL